MQNSLAFVTLILSLAVGCVPQARDRSNSPGGAKVGAKTDDDSRAKPAVEAGVDNGVVWAEKGIAYENVTIDLGYRVEHTDGARWLEPVAIITRDKAPVANAMVFNSLATAVGGDVTADEVATVYEQSPDSETAWYAQGKLRLPDGTAQCVVRFRIELPRSQQALTRDVTIELNTAAD